MGENKKVIQGGTTANKNGKVLEDMVRSVAKMHGFKEANYKEWRLLDFPVQYLVKNVPYDTIYGTKGHTEFVLSATSGNIRIECKWQQVNGSVDEKFPYLFENMKHVEEPKVILLLGGGGYKKAARDWLYNNCKEYKLKDIVVYGQEEFTIWANSNMYKL